MKRLIISSRGVINDISSTFKGNRIEVKSEDDYAYSAIISEYNAQIKNINSSFIGNEVDATSDNLSTVYGTLVKALSKIDNVTSEFAGNKVTSNSARINGGMLEVATELKQQKILKLSNEDFVYLKGLKTPFILQQQDECPSFELSQLLWDLNYWLENNRLTLEEFVVKAGNYYYNTYVEKSNIYIIALLLKRMANQYATYDLLLEKVEELSQKPILSKFNFFSEETKNQTDESAIHIMTYHKSKGDEFDYVFIPALSEEILPLELNEIKIKSKERFIEAIKALNLRYKRKNENELKTYIAQENMRLFYVAITRAKKQLFVTCAKKYKKFSKVKDTKVSLLFENFFGVKNEQNSK